MAGILEGLKVVEMGNNIAIPAAGAILADWGADVVKVEPLTGEMMRGMGSVQGVKVTGINMQFELLNRDKRALALDLKKESGKTILHQLVKLSDVFIANYEVSALKKLQLDYTTLSKLNPQLIYAVVTGYGTKGPDKDERGFDFTAGWARSGTQHLMAEGGGTPPAQRAGMYDRTTGMHTVAGVCAALFNREKTGKGQEIELSLYHVGVYTIATDIQNALNGLPSPTNDRRKASSPLWNSYRAGDDRWFQFAMLQSDIHWSGLCQAMERPDLEHDPRFNTMYKRAENCEELIRIMDEIFSSRDRNEWEKRFRDNEVIYGRIETPEEVVNDPQAYANDFFTEIDHPKTGKMKYVTMPVDFRQNPASVKTPSPEVGQHNEEILLELGYSWDDISRLKEQGVIL
jgi:crotonobetainyl-CoA:carnitine CoA-transferase CaiB-like acyl-CoA transferase